jgi:hypothetical protein
MSGEREEWYIETSSRYVARVREELEHRWKTWSLDLAGSEVHEVAGGLLARQCSLAVDIAQSPALWTPTLGPLVLRAMADVRITLAWILLKPSERSRQYIHYGLGQQKLLLEHLKAKGVDDAHTRSMERWINSQRYTWLTEVNVGAWADIPLREMADEAGLIDFYRFAYQPLSVAAHSMWNHVGRFDLEQCREPLHRDHHVPIIRDHSPDLHYWDDAATMLAESFADFDESVGLSVEFESAASVLDAALEDYAMAHGENLGGTTMDAAPDAATSATEEDVNEDK